MKRQALWLLPLVVLTAIVVGAGVAFRLARSPDEAPGGDEESPRASAEGARDEQDPAAARLEGRGEATPPTLADEGPLPDGWIEVTARVVDAAEHPVADASATIRIAAETVATTEADREGRLLLRTCVPPGDGVLQATLRVHHPTAGVAWRTVVLRPDPRRSKADPSFSPDRDLGVIRLRPATPLEIQVVCDSSCSPPAMIHVAQAQSQFGPGEAHFLVVLATDADGRARIWDLHAGRWRILATCGGCGRGSVLAKLPREAPGPLTIRLGAARSLRVHVVDRYTGEGVAGATVEVREIIQHPDGSELSPYALLEAVPPTDDEGRTTIDGLAEEDALRLLAHAPGYPVPMQRHRRDAPGHAGVGAGVREVEIEVAAVRTIAWPIEADVLPVPPEGTTVALRPAPGNRGEIPSSGVVEDGALVVAGWASGVAVAIAETPDGATAYLYAPTGATEGGEITFALARTITVALRYADGAPAPEIPVVARNGGGNDLLAPVLSGEDGIARLEDLAVSSPLLEPAHVYVLGDAPHGGGREIGIVDIAKGDRRLEAVVGRDRDVIVRVRVDGKPELPRLAWIQIGSFHVYDVERDEANAEWRFSWRPPLATMKTFLAAAAYDCVAAERSRTIEVTPGADPIEVDLDLVRAGTLVGIITRPADGKHHITVERWSPEEGVWYEDRGGWLGVSLPTEADENGRIRFAPLRPGRYRLRDGYTQASSTEVEVRGGQTTEASFDLTESFEVSGRVEAKVRPAPTRFAVRVEGLPDHAPDGMYLGAPTPREDYAVTCGRDGHFRLRLPGPGPWTLVPEGLLLKPARAGGSVTVDGPADDLVLELVDASTATVRFDRAFEGRLSGGRARPVRVLLYRGEVGGVADHECRGWREEQTVTFAGIPLGTWTVWIDAHPFVPAVLEAVTLAEGKNDLGLVEASDGASVTFRILLPEGQSLGFETGVAMAVEPPLYTRGVDFGGSRREFVLTGLGVGTFRLVLPRLGFDETIEIVTGDEALERQVAGR